MSLPQDASHPKRLTRPAKSKAGTENASTKLDLLLLEDRTVPAGVVTGSVFLDFNGNGLFDTATTIPNEGSGTVGVRADQGFGNIVVTAFDSSNTAQGSATTIANGTYTLNMTGTGPYRIEFGGLPAGVFFGSQGSSGGTPAPSGTAVQFVNDGNSANINLSVLRTQDLAGLSASNPLLVTTVYLSGAFDGANANEESIVSFPYSSGATINETSPANYQDPAAHKVAVTVNQVGATWGLAYDTINNKIFAAAYTKRHVGYGPSGPGAIYQIDLPSNIPNSTDTSNPITTASLFLDLNAATANAAAGVSFRTTVGWDYLNDGVDLGTNTFTGWDAVGKSGLGGLDVDATGTFMYTVGLANKALYKIAITQNANGTISAGAVTAFTIPTPASATGTIGADFRPFAVQVYQGRVYIGAVNSAEATQSAADLKGYVFAFDPNANAGAGAFVNTAGTVSALPIVEFDLNYLRGIAYLGDNRIENYSANWNPWSPTVQTLSAGGDTYIVYPQPMFTGIAFDENGNMIIGLRDRTGDQTGFDFALDNPSNPTNLSRGIATGDTVRANGTPTTGWTVETITGEGAGNEFYWGDVLPDDQTAGNVHQEVSVGGVLQLAGFPDVAVTAFDPAFIPGRFNAGGVRWYSNTNGTSQKAYELYESGPGTATFAKANGVGDLIAIQPAIREIGNRIFNDANGNGRQDASELGIANLQVVLCLDGTAIATATTDAAGNYFFSSNFGTSTASKQFGVNLNSRIGTYTICLPVAQAPLTGLELTSLGAAVSQNTVQADSKGVLIGGNAVATIVLPAQGSANHNYDIGFRTPQPNIGVVSGIVYVDRDRGGVLDAGDTRINNVTLFLIDTNGATLSSTTTLPDGSYSFTGLAFGTYSVREVQPVSFADGPVNPGSAGATSATNLVSNIIVDVGNPSRPNNNFGELLGSLSGVVYEDVDVSNSLTGVDNRLQSVTIILTGGPNNISLTTQTDVNGAYNFTNLEFGAYTVQEVQPAGFNSQSTNPGTPGGGMAGTVGVNDAIQTITLTTANPGLDSPQNNFGEVRPAVPPVVPPPIPAQLSGFVYQDENINGVRDPGERPIPGTTLQLFQELTDGSIVAAGSTTTNANGFYQFVNLTPGNYRVIETQPVNFFDALESIGSTGGTVGNDILSFIPLVSGANSINNNFGEVPCSNIFGYVFVDANSNGLFDPGELGIPNTQIVLSGTAFAGTVLSQPLNTSLVSGGLTATTDASGRWSFSCVPPGDYTITQIPPAGFGGFFQQNSARVPIGSIGNGQYGNVQLTGPTSGALNFGTTTVPPSFAPISRDPIVTPGDPSKREFLSSSALGAATTTVANPLLRQPEIALALDPQFSIRNTNAQQPTYVAVGAGAGFSPIVRVFDYTSGVEKFRFLAYESNFTGGVSVAVADINGDGVSDIITGAGVGGGPRVRVFNGVTGTPILDFFAYSQDFRGGVYVAGGDVDGDGRADIVTGAGAGGGPHVKVFNSAGVVTRETFPFAMDFSGGVRVAVGDLTGTGRRDVIAASGPGGNSQIVTMDGRSLALINRINPFASGFQGGVWLAAGDLDGDGIAEIIAGAGAGGGPNVRTFNAAGTLLSDVLVYEANFSGGVRVAARDIDGDGRAEIITGAGIGGASRVSIFVGPNLNRQEDFFAFDDGVRTGIFVG